MDNLNEYLQPTNSPIANYQGAVPFYQFDAQNERNVIDLTKIRNFSFSAGTGGTLTLGGVGNGNGQLIIKDSSGSQIGVLNNEGLTITGGDIEVYNSSGSLTFDASGLVSQNNFTLFNFNGAPAQSITGTAATDITSSEGTIVVGRTVNVLFLFSSENFLVESVGNTANGELGLSIDGVYPRCVIRVRNGGNNLETRTNFFVTTLSAGTHPVKAQARLTTIFGGTPSLNVTNFSWTYIILGT